MKLMKRQQMGVRPADGYVKERAGECTWYEARDSAAAGLVPCAVRKQDTRSSTVAEARRQPGTEGSMRSSARRGAASSWQELQEPSPAPVCISGSPLSPSVCAVPAAAKLKPVVSG
mmetsp:Transcript_9125/g.19567  ORF Transcript_9125/g.19567 Transcript_9125/m.19567 type:complete len:116 (+) Transcript_9125:635-982(+)